MKIVIQGSELPASWGKGCLSGFCSCGAKDGITFCKERKGIINTDQVKLFYPTSDSISQRVSFCVTYRGGFVSVSEEI